MIMKKPSEINPVVIIYYSISTRRIINCNLIFLLANLSVRPAGSLISRLLHHPYLGRSSH